MNLGITPKFNATFNQQLIQTNYNNSCYSYSPNNSSKVAAKPQLNFTGSIFTSTEQKKVIELYIKYCRMLGHFVQKTEDAVLSGTLEVCNRLKFRSDVSCFYELDKKAKLMKYGFTEDDINQLCKVHCTEDSEKFNKLLVETISKIKESDQNFNNELSNIMQDNHTVILNLEISRLKLDESLTMGRKDLEADGRLSETCDFGVDPVETYKHFFKFPTKDMAISRNHAVITRSSGNTLLISDSSRCHTTYVNNQQISQPTILNENDTIKLGYINIPIL